MNPILPPAPAYIITGTDTDVGKTTAAMELLRISGKRYWKPLQSGTDSQGRTDTDIVRIATGLPAEHFLPESYCFMSSLSPHRAAELDGVTIDPQKILNDYQRHIDNISSNASGLLIEGAGGLMVPITRDLLQIDLFTQMQAITVAPIILVARTTLGTINHTLLSLEAIRARRLPLAGILFCGLTNDENIQTILDFSRRSTLTENLGHITFPH